MVKICLVGCGGLAKHYVKAIKNLPFEITTAVDLNINNAKKLVKSVDYFTTFNQAIKYNNNLIDAVCILTPHNTHYDIANLAINKKKHILLEKPITTDLATSKKLLKKSKKNKNKVFMIGENADYWPEIVLAKKLINQDEIGKIITVHSHYYESMKYAPFDKKNLGWRGKIDSCGGGILIDGGSHWIRPLKIWMGNVKSVIGSCHYPTKEMEGESHVDAILKFENNKTATLKATVLMDSDISVTNDGWFKIIGTKGDICIKNSFDGGLTLYNNKYPEGNDLLINKGFVSSYFYELKDFYDGIKYKKKIISSPEEALNDLKIIKSIYKSNKENKWIYL